LRGLVGGDARLGFAGEGGGGNAKNKNCEQAGGEEPK
jgi:hypothetical protein